MSPETFVSIINQNLPEPHASLLAGMVFGQQYSRLPADFYQALVTTGTLHVVALSGTNITILVRFIEKLTFFFSKRLAAILTLGIIIGFVFFVGLEPPVVRAAIMGGIATLGDFFGRRHYALTSLFFAGGIMLFVWPEWLYSLSFQLSFLATLGIVIFDSGKRFRRDWTKVSLIREILGKAKIAFVENWRTTLAAQILITPLLVYNFGRLSLVAPLSNALLGWSIQYITVFGILTALGGLIFAPFARIISFISWFFLEYFILIVFLTSRIPLSEVVF